MMLDRIIEEMNLMEPMTPASQRILQIAGDPKSSISDLVEVIQFDQALTANLLRICNSAGFGLQREVNSVKQAAALLGMKKVACLAMIGQSPKSMRKAQEGYDLPEGDLWRHSVASALIVQDLADRRAPMQLPLLFTAALLKDIGKVVLSRYVKDLMLEILSEVQKKNLSFLEAEKNILGIDHAELGGRLAEKWRFSGEMVEIIRNHHNPEKASTKDILIPIVYLGDCISMMMGIALGSDGLAYRFYAQVAERLRFSEADLQKSMIRFREKLAMVEELVSVSQGERTNGV